MSFDFFNVSHLAFGSKLTKAFRQLERELEDAESIVGTYIQDISYLGSYVNRNYKVPFPKSGDSPVRIDEFFDLVDDRTMILKLQFLDGVLSVKIATFDRDTQRFSISEGNTELKEGYALFTPSISNSSPFSVITFEEEEQTGKTVLFKYRVNSQDIIELSEVNERFFRITCDMLAQINSFSWGEAIKLPYTAKGYEAILVTGDTKAYQYDRTKIEIKVNGRAVYDAGGSAPNENQYSFPIYLKPKDVLSIGAGTYTTARRINYKYL